MKMEIQWKSTQQTGNEKARKHVFLNWLKVIFIFIFICAFMSTWANWRNNIQKRKSCYASCLTHSAHEPSTTIPKLQQEIVLCIMSNTHCTRHLIAGQMAQMRVRPRVRNVDVATVSLTSTREMLLWLSVP